MQTKSILVTGAGGFIGSHLCEMLVQAGYKVYGFVHYNSRNYCGWLEDSALRDEIEIQMGDIRDFDNVNSAVTKADAICHLAALIGIPYSYVSPLGYIRTNIEGTYNVLESSRQQGKKPVLHTSTSETYGSAQYVPIDEKHPLEGQSPYSATKIGADQLALSYAFSFEMPVTVIRPFNTYGPRQSLRAVIPTIISQIASNNDTIELGDVSPKRDLTYVADTCIGFIKALETDKGAGKVLNLGTGQIISIKILAEKIMSLMGRSVKIITKDDRIRPEKSEVRCLQSDNSLAKKLLQWEPEVSLEQGLSKTIEFIQNNMSTYNSNGYII